MQSFPNARAARPGVVISIATLLLCVGACLSACAPDRPEIPTGRRVWEGPSTTVASRGVTTYERREIAQQVPFPVCISVAAVEYRFAQVTPYEGGGVNPLGLNDTFYRLDRWRLWTRPGPLEGQTALFLTARGSAGIVAEYPRVPPGEACST